MVRTPVTPSLAQWDTSALKKIHDLFKPVPPNSADEVPATPALWGDWKTQFDSGSVNAFGTFDADDFTSRLGLLDVDIAEATDRKSASVRELATITAQQKTLQAALGTLTTLKQKMTALKAAVDGLQVEAGPLIFTIPDSQPTDKNNIVQTRDLNAANKLVKIAGLAKADKYLDRTAAAVSTLTDVPAKLAVVEFKIQFMNAPRFEISSGLLVPFKPYHTYTVGLTQASATSPVFSLTLSDDSALASTACVVGVIARFDTTTDDKDDDTLLRVTLGDPAGTVFAEVDNVTGHWDNDSTNYVNLFITAQRQRSQLAGSCVVEVHIDPNGNDPWDFNLTLIVSFSDGIQAQSYFSGHWLGQDDRTNDYSVTNLGG